jgi:hypothetical protein
VCLGGGCYGRDAKLLGQILSEDCGPIISAKVVNGKTAGGRGERAAAESYTTSSL